MISLAFSFQENMEMLNIYTDKSMANVVLIQILHIVWQWKRIYSKPQRTEEQNTVWKSFFHIFNAILSLTNCNEQLCLYANKTQSCLSLNVEVKLHFLPQIFKHMQFCPGV